MGVNRKTILAVSIPALLLAVAVAFGIWQWRSARALGVSLNSAKEKAYYSALDGLVNMETDLGKLLIAESYGQQALLLGHIASLAASVQENLTALPAAYGADADGMKFLTQTADYALSLATAAAEGKLLSERDVAQLSELQQKCVELRRHLENGAGFVYEERADREKASGIDYPSLLYDGPFSDGTRMGRTKGLTGATITEDEAVAIATAFVENVRGATRAVDTGGPVPAYGVSLTLSDLTITAAVTQQGGKVLWMAPETAGFDTQLDMDECILHAKAFLTSRGFGEMRESYYQRYDGIAVINFAAVQEDVILYPDLVKVQVRMDTGAVIGLEAGNYWMNHVKRERLHPKLTEAEARGHASSRLTIEAASLCVIPIEDGMGTGRTEALCWEFSGTYAENRYLIYIDSETGEELKVLKVVLGGGGVLTI